MPTRSQFETEAEWLEHVRLWFAGQALANPALCTGTGVREADLNKWFRGRYGITEFEIAAAQAGRYADAMLAARKTEGE